MNRHVNLPENHSFFLFGARGTGKTWLLHDRLVVGKGAYYIDLLSGRDFDELSRDSASLSNRIERLPPSGSQWVVIDEVQRLPEILNIVHLEIEAHSRSRMGVTSERPPGREICFALTGSSARKLKRGKANLLAGRAFLRHLYPLTYGEFPAGTSINTILQWGALPAIVAAESDQERSELLVSYVHTYLREEILAEQLARDAPPFRKFLESAAQTNGEILNFSAISRDVGVSPNTVQSYYQILEDTLLAYRVPPFHKSIRKRQKSGPKYYFFDCGIKRALLGIHDQPLSENTYGYGRAFEHFLFLEMFRAASYQALNYEFSYLQTKDNLEIDFVIDRPSMPLALVEVKSTNCVRDDHLKALKSLGQDLPASEAYCLSLDPVAKKIAGINVLPWRQGLTELGFQ